jgi:hypothetical protein
MRRFGARQDCIVTAGMVGWRSRLANRGEIDRVSEKDGIADILGEDITKHDGKGAEVGENV